MKIGYDIDLQAAYQILNFIVHKYTDGAAGIAGLTSEAMLGYDETAKRLILKNHATNNPEQIALISDIDIADGSKIYYSDIDPEIFDPVVVLNEGDMWYAPGATELKIRTDGTAWGIINAPDTLVPDTLIDIEIPKQGIAIHPTTLGIYQNRHVSDITITGAAGSGNPATHNELIADNFTLIAGATNPVIAVLDYTAVGTGVAPGDWGQHPDFPADDLWGQYNFTPDPGTPGEFVVVDVHRDSDTPDTRTPIQFYVRHSLPSFVRSVDVYSGDYDSTDDSVGNNRENHNVDYVLDNENAQVKLSFYKYESVSASLYTVTITR